MGMSPIKKKIPKMGRQLKWLERWFCTPEDRVRVPACPQTLFKKIMKVYVVVVNYHPANAPQNYETDCQIFLDKKQAEKYKEAKEKEFPIRWGGEYNHCKLIKKHL